MTNALTAKASAQNTDTIKEMALKLANDFQDGADAVLDALLSILEARLPEAEFVSFCEELEGAL